MSNAIYTLSRAKWSNGILLEINGKRAKILTGSYEFMKYAADEFLMINGIKEKRYLPSSVFSRLMSGHPKKLTVIYDAGLEGGKTDLPSDVSSYFDD